MKTIQRPYPPRDGLATIQQAATFLTIGRTSVCAMIRDGQLPAATIRTFRRIPWAALHKIADDAIKAVESAPEE